MSLRRWQPDRVLTLEGARAAIQERFPHIATDGLRHLGSGWEFDAYLTSDGWVFRFPRRRECADFLDREVRVLAVVRAALPAAVAVPKVELLGPPTDEFPYPFAGHRFIAGIGADRIEPRCYAALANDVGKALGDLHAVPDPVAHAAGIHRMHEDPLASEAWFDHGLAIATELLGMDAVVDAAIRWMHGLRPPLHRYDEPWCLIHHDLGPEHLIVDPESGQLVGIIDWTDAIIGDPARDIAVFVPSLGWPFTQAALPLDVGFADRLQFLARLLATMWLTEAYEQQGEVQKHMTWVKRAFADSKYAG
jgi:aminoglycoside phosphotransferase (APT) family kinase protein